MIFIGNSVPDFFVFHSYCMEMREAAPTAVKEALQTNYRTLLLAIRKQELDDLRKEQKGRG